MSKKGFTTHSGVLLDLVSFVAGGFNVTSINVAAGSVGKAAGQ